MLTSKLSQLDSSPILVHYSSASSDSDEGAHPDSHSSIIEHRDPNFLEELMQSPVNNVPAAQDIADHHEMRQRVRDFYLHNFKEPIAKRVFPPASISTHNISVTYQNNNTFSVRVYDQAERNKFHPSGLRPALIMYHEGGWTHGIPDMNHELAKFFASKLRAVVIGVDYRLAPEYPYPHPLNDCFAALDWTLDNAAKYMLDPGRVAVWGFSAGGNLAAAVALKDARENTISHTKHVNLVAPVTCHPALYPPTLRLHGSSSTKFGTDKQAHLLIYMIERLWELYAPTSFSDPYAFVLHTVPPAHHHSVHITVSGCDTLRDEGIAYTLHLRKHGIDTQLEIVPGAPHEG